MSGRVGDRVANARMGGSVGIGREVDVARARGGWTAQVALTTKGGRCLATILMCDGVDLTGVC
jgi:hypothetical protein